LFEEFHPTPKRKFQTPLTIGVISDTHIFQGGRRRLPPEINELFQRFGCGLILHAGDVNTPHTLAKLGEVAPVLVVTGNNDDAEMHRIAPAEMTFEVGRFKVAMLHGDGGASARSEARRRFAGKADLVVYGHSHIPLIELEQGSILFNPGSATDRRWQEHFGVGLIAITDEKIAPELVLYNDPRDLKNVRPD
jgi:putative phosphoesterase